MTLDLSCYAKSMQAYTDGNAPKDLQIGNGENGHCTRLQVRCAADPASGVGTKKIASNGATDDTGMVHRRDGVCSSDSCHSVTSVCMGRQHKPVYCATMAADATGRTGTGASARSALAYMAENVLHRPVYRATHPDRDGSRGVGQLRSVLQLSSSGHLRAPWTHTLALAFIASLRNNLHALEGMGNRSQNSLVD